MHPPDYWFTESEPTTSAPSEMDKGAPEVGESSASSEAPIPIPPPQPSSTLSPPYEVGVMRRSSGYRGVHPYNSAVFQSVPRQVAGQPFQQWLALTQVAHGLPASDSSGIDISVPDVIKLNVGVIGMGHQSGPGVIGTDVPVIAVLGSSSSVDSRVGEAIGGTDGQPGTRSSQRR